MNKSAFDLETAITTFLIYKEWGHSDDLAAFLEFVRKEGLKIKEG